MVTQSQTIGRHVSRLVREAQAGDKDAMDELITAHLPLIYNIIGRALDGHPDVDDLVQNTMLQALRGLAGLREPDRFRSWLVTIAYRQIQLHLRARSTSQRRWAPEPVELPDPDSDFAERTTAELIAAGQRRELVEAVRWLDEPDRRLLGLWWQEAAGELTRGELAAALRVKPKHAAVRVQRMKAQLDAARGVVLALRARPRCPDLADQVRRWNGVADPLWRKRLVRHVRDCPRCGPRGQGLIAPEELLLGIAALPVPALLAAGVKAGLPAKAAVHLHPFLQSLQPVLHSKALAVAAATTVAAGGGLAYAVHHTSLPPDRDNAIVAPIVAAPPTAPGSVRSSASATPTPRPATGTGARTADIYVAPGGSDGGDGSAARPYATLNKAVAVVRPGQTIALRGGTYRPAQSITISTSGTATKRIVLTNYRDERPVIDASGIPADQWAITQRTAYWTVQGLEVTNAKSHAYVCRGCRQNVFRRLSLHGNVRSGLMLRDPGTAGNQVLDSDFFDNRDPARPGEVGIGLGIAFGDGEGNVVRGNRTFGNAAAGFDLGSFTSGVTLEYNWSYRNDATGFVLGGGSPPASAAHRLRHNAAWDNAGHGFADDGNTGALELTNNTAFGNRGTGFFLPVAAATVRSNVAVDNAAPVSPAQGTKQSRNSWQQDGATKAMFRSTDSTAAEGPRSAAGRLPRTDYLTTGNGQGASMAGT